jgi:hypothetical protein
LETEGAGLLGGGAEIFQPVGTEKRGAGRRDRGGIAAGAHLEEEHAAEAGVAHGAEFVGGGGEVDVAVEPEPVGVGSGSGGWGEETGFEGGWRGGGERGGGGGGRGEREGERGSEGDKGGKGGAKCSAVL